MKDKSSNYNYKNHWAESLEYRERNERLKTKKVPTITIYPWTVNEKIEFRIPPTILEAISKIGWNVFGVYEVVKEEIARHNMEKKMSKIETATIKEEKAFNDIVQKLINNEISYKINFCTHPERDGSWSAYLMGEGAEQLIARKSGFKHEKEIVDLYLSLGVKHILPI